MLGIVPRDTGFHELFRKSAAVLRDTAEAYQDMVTDYARHKEHLARIRQCEHDGDEIAHETFGKVDTSFITPFDREDIHTLVMQVDDVIDAVDAAAKRIVLFKLSEPGQWLVKQADVLRSACILIGQAIEHLKDIRRPDHIREILTEIHRLENEGDDNNNAALTELYDTCPSPVMIMKLKEVYDLTETAIDGCEDIANTIERIILKGS